MATIQWRPSANALGSILKKHCVALLAGAVLSGAITVGALAADSGNPVIAPIISLLLGKSAAYNGPPLSHQAAMVGPLSGSSVQAFQVEDLRTVQEGPINAAENNSNLLSAGTFDLSLIGVADSAWVVVAASGGEDIDADGNGAADTAPTENQGTLHALAQASDWRTKHIRITPLSEIAWRYVENMIPAVSAEELKIRLADLARYLVKTDISGNGTIDWDDILAFDPANAAHRDKLAFDYTWLTTADDEGQTILASLQAGKKDSVLAQLDATFSWLMTRFPVPDSRYHSVKIKLAVFGSGSAASGAPHNLSVNSTLAEPVYEDHIFLPQNASEQITFTAAPTAETQILSWTGCETVSADLSQCMVPLNKSQSVVVNFGRTETQLKAPVHDLSRAYNIVGANTVSVLLPDDMDDLIAEMAAANVDDFIVGDDGGGFLRRITGINQISSTYYQLETAEAALDEVVEQGTGHLYKQLTNGDLEGYTAPAAPSQRAMVSSSAFTGLVGTSLKVSERPDDATFTILLGESSDSSESLRAEAAGTGSLAANVTLVDRGDGSTLTANGEIKLTVSFDTGVDFAWGRPDNFKVIAIVEAEESVTLTASRELAKFDIIKKKIGTLRFAPIPIAGLPVWITPTMDVYLFAEGKIDAEASFGAVALQRVEGGVLYNRETGFSPHKSFTTDNSLTLPGKISASIKGGVQTAFSTKIYDATGPSIPMERYIKIAASVEGELFGDCTDIVVQFAEGSNISFKWDMSGSTKIGKLLHLDQLEALTEFSIAASERNVAKWTVYSTCPKGSFLSIEGDGIFSTIDLGDPNGLATTLTVSNTGDEILHWNTYGVPPEVNISPSSGELAPGAEEAVLMSVATAGLPVGRYLHKPFFYNEASVGQNLPDEEFGNTYKLIDITVNGTISDAPTITSATSPAVGQIGLEWSFSPSGFDPFVGFQIYATQTPEYPDTYQLVHTASIYERQVLLTGFTPGATYSFDMRAYSNNGAQPGPFSNKVSVDIEGSNVVSVGTIAQTPMSGPPGTTFAQWGTGFTPNSTGTMHFRKPDGTEYPTMQQAMDNTGHFDITYTAPTNKEPGEYTWWIIDGPTGVSSNQVTYTIEGTGVNPTIAQAPMSGPPGTIFAQWGTGFTPNSMGTMHFRKPDGTEYPTMQQAMDNTGHFDIFYTAPTDKEPGNYTWWVVDGSTGISSNQVTYTIEGTGVNPTIAQTPMSGPPGTTFAQWGTGFTPNSTGTMHFRKPDGTEYPTMQQAMDSTGHFDISYTAPTSKAPGNYTWWVIDGPTGISSNQVTYTINSP
ncbi:MAG: fibronectin type III domain-containing protein [Candidatus Electrothrix sp. AW5]|nr:fibronectin type III domain-containing protein [Candidatus Electrothrix gigas]